MVDWLNSVLHRVPGQRSGHKVFQHSLLLRRGFHRCLLAGCPSCAIQDLFGERDIQLPDICCCQRKSEIKFVHLLDANSIEFSSFSTWTNKVDKHPHPRRLLHHQNHNLGQFCRLPMMDTTCAQPKNKRNLSLLLVLVFSFSWSCIPQPPWTLCSPSIQFSSEHNPRHCLCNLYLPWHQQFLER